MIEVTTQDKPERSTSKPTNSSISMQSQTNGLGFQSTLTTAVPKSLIPNYPKEPNRSFPRMTIAPNTPLPEKSSILPKSSPEIQAQLQRPVINSSSTSGLSASALKYWKSLKSSELADKELMKKWEALHLATLVQKYGKNAANNRKPSTESIPENQGRPLVSPENQTRPQVRSESQMRQHQISPVSQRRPLISPELIDKGLTLTPVQNQVLQRRHELTQGFNKGGQRVPQVSPEGQRVSQVSPRFNQVSQKRALLNQTGPPLGQTRPQIGQNGNQMVQNAPQTIQNRSEMSQSGTQMIQSRPQFIQNGHHLKPRLHQVRHQIISQTRLQMGQVGYGSLGMGPGKALVNPNQPQGSPRMNSSSPGVPRQSSPMVPLQQFGGPQTSWQNVPRAIIPTNHKVVQSNGIVLTPGLYNAQQQRLILFQNQYHQPGPKVLQQPPKMPQLLPLKTMISSQNKSDSQANTSVPVPSKSTSDPETGQASSKLRLVRPWEKRRKSKEGEAEVVTIDEDYDKDSNDNEEGTDEQEHIPLKKRRLIMYELDTNYSHIKFGNCL